MTTIKNLKIGDKALITVDNWFFAPDGKSYRAVWGTIKGVFSDEATLGIKTNSKSTNWYLSIGIMDIAGCQIHYVIKCEKCNIDRVDDYSTHEGMIKEYNRPTSIFNADLKF